MINTKCLNCNEELIQMQDIREETWQRERSLFNYLECPKCKSAFVPELILHPIIRNIKIEFGFKL
jgi:hypothetical protein